MNQTLSARNIVKHYGGVVALADGHLDVKSGEVVALIGANGSGKSTISKVINGVVILDGGQLLLDDKPVQFSSPQAAKDMGISTVFQELSLIPQMTVADNIWLTREPKRGLGVINRKEVFERTEELLNLFKGTYKTELTPDTLVSTLPPDERQIIEILKAISFDPWMIFRHARAAKEPCLALIAGLGINLHSKSRKLSGPFTFSLCAVCGISKPEA